MFGRIVIYLKYVWISSHRSHLFRIFILWNLLWFSGNVFISFKYFIYLLKDFDNTLGNQKTNCGTDSEEKELDNV